MSGKILIVDEVATNRIVLKVKLSAAHFDVIQATGGADALRVAARDRPDVILVSAALADMDCADFLGALRARADLAATPVLTVLPADAAETRMQALRAGADDVIARPFDDEVLLARLRALLRQHGALQDLRVHSAPIGPAGFADAGGLFQAQGRIALIAPDKRDALTLRARLDKVTRHDLTASDAASAVSAPAPDVFVIALGPGEQDAGLRLMAELRAAPLARHSRIMVLVPEGAARLTATLLDMGASDVIAGTIDTGELALRMARQIRYKRATDDLRDHLQDGMRAAITDPLTGLHNRRFALPFLQRLADSATRPFAVMLADLDHFKRINDQHGHLVGDRVLAHVAGLLRRTLRDTDMIARIGGEEFLIVLPDTDRDAARASADRLCRMVRLTPLPSREGAGAVPVTISIGVTLALPGAQGPGAEALIDQADRALYCAKARGRDTVRLAARPAA
jgi:two-component system cell cycle response regulator